MSATVELSLYKRSSIVQPTPSSPFPTTTIIPRSPITLPIQSHVSAQVDVPGAFTLSMFTHNSSRPQGRAARCKPCDDLYAVPGISTPLHRVEETNGTNLKMFER